MERKLASIQRISSLSPIDGADKIEKATVLGWELVVAKKDNFKVGDLVVYCEVDSILPDKPEFEFLRERKFRIKTIKLRGQVSQGIAFPLSILGKGNFKEGDDVTELMGVRKHDPQAEFERKESERLASIDKNRMDKFLKRYSWYRKLVFKPGRKPFPSFIKKTDEDRIQLFPDYYEKWGHLTFDITEKVDGCLSGRMLIHTDQGYKRIAEIVCNKLNVQVLSHNLITGRNEFKPITDYHKIKSNREVYRIGVGCRGKGNRPKFIECTDNHKLLTTLGWKRADELKENDILMHYNKNFSYEIKQMILGCLLGDSSFNSNSPNGNYRTVNFNHSIKQEDYFNYKKQLLGNLFISENDAISGYGSILKRGKLVTNLQTIEIAKNCIIDGKKKITSTWVDQLSPIALAFWYMDDGSIKNRDDDSLGCRIILNTQGFSIEEVLLLKSCLQTKFNIDASIGDKNTYKGYILQLGVIDAEIFCSLVAPYIHSSMKYKLPLKYRNIPCIYENESFDVVDGIIKTNIISIEKKSPISFGKYVYDLSIKDNENYFAQNILVHNCSATYFMVKNLKRGLFRKKWLFGVCSRNFQLLKPDSSSYWTLAKNLDIERKMRSWCESNGKGLIIQGEAVGEKIQGNKYNYKAVYLFVFNVAMYDKGQTTYLGPYKQHAICADMELMPVHLLATEFKLLPTMAEMVQYSTGNSTHNSSVLREGIVVRNYENNISFKIINPDFLLQHSE